MSALAATAALLATGCLLGTIVFFSFVVAPLVFTRLEAPVAARFIRAIFPWYYAMTIGFAAAGALALAARDPVAASTLAAVAAAGLLARQWLMPRVNRARDAMLAGDEASGPRFQVLHRASVVINLAQLIAAGWVLAGLGG